jgi:hypothetical protein
MKKLMVLFGLAAAACSSGAKDGVTLSARLAASDGGPLPADGGTAQAATGIELSRVRIAVRRLRLERQGGSSEVEIAQGPLLVDASGAKLAGALLELVTNNVPPGAYDKLKIDIERVDAAPAGAFDDLVQRHVSVLLEGTVDQGTVAGGPFTFASDLEAELEHEGRFEVGATVNNITLSIDASKWFQAADGSRLDPRDVANRAAIEKNIRASFRAFEDDDKDGQEDHDDRDAGDDDDGDAGDDHGVHDGGDDHRDAGAPDGGHG